MRRHPAPLVLAAVVLVVATSTPAVAAHDAADDAYGTNEDEALVVAAPGVLANDGSVPGLTAANASDPANGSVSLSADGGFTYTPDPGFHGEDSFTYEAHVPDEAPDSATVVIDVNGRPVAGDVPAPDCSAADPDPFGGSFPIVEDWGEFLFIPGPCGAHAADPEGDEVTFELVDGPVHGTAFLDPEFGIAGYTADPDFSTPEGDWVSDTFTYRAFDGAAQSDPATFRIWVAPVNDPPSFTAGPSLVVVDEDSGPYASEDPWATDIVAGPPSESGQTVTFDVSVRPEDEHAFAVPPAIDVDGTLSFTPAADTPWLSEVTVVAHDDGGLEDYEDWGVTGIEPDDTSEPVVFNIVIDTVGDPPAATALSESVIEDVAKTINLEGTDPDGDNPLTFAASDPDHGTVSLGARACTGGTTSTCTQLATYTPDDDYAGADSFTYTVSDGSSVSEPATVSITVASVPDAPNAVNDTLNAVEDGGAITINPRTNDNDADGDPLAVTAVTQGSKGSVTFAAGSVTYTPNANAAGADSFTYTIDDGTGRTDSATVSVAIASVNDAPTIGRPWRLYGPEDGGSTTRKARTVLAAGGGETGQTLTAHVTSNGNPTLFSTQPAMTVVPGGINVTWTPAANRHGRALIRFVIRDTGGTANGGTNQSVERWFWITVMDVNDPPNAVNDVSFTVKRNAGPTALAVLANDTTAPDVGESLLITERTNGANGTVAITGNGTGLTYQPVTGFTGTDTFTYTVSDGRGGTDTATVLVTVVP